MNSTASLALWMDKATYRAGEKAKISVRLLQGEKPVPYEPIQLVLTGVVTNNVAKYSFEETIATLSTDEKGHVSFTYSLASHGSFIIRALAAGYPEACAEIGCDVKPTEWAQPLFILKMSDAIGGDELISIIGEGFTGTVQAVAEPLNRKNVNQSRPSDDAINLTLVQKDVRRISERKSVKIEKFFLKKYGFLKKVRNFKLSEMPFIMYNIANNQPVPPEERGVGRLLPEKFCCCFCGAGSAPVQKSYGKLVGEKIKE